MNYRHAYHAGNFADVFKHAVLARIIEYLKRKDAAFRVIDTHAGRGLYDLSAPEPQKTGEWLEGIGRLLKAGLAPEAAALLAPLINVVRAYETVQGLAAYPGSPALARALLRKQDRLTACELHPDDHAALAALFAGDYQVKTLKLDGWLAPGAQLPPKEKRGLVLIDPPFEQAGEFARLLGALEKGVKRWPGGIFMLWYPLKNTAETAAFHAGLRQTGIDRLMTAELWAKKREDGVFHGSGLIIRNPPFVLADELAAMLPALTAALAQDENAGWKVEG
jgi:23S rRNA (adenine2030-N6)-methyltransferase